MNQPAPHAPNPLPVALPAWLRPRAKRSLVLLLATLLVWGWFDVRQRGAVDAARPWVHKTDLTVYTEAGAAFFDGRDPYTVTNPRGWGYLYPPLFAILMAPLHALEPRNQAFVWFLLSLLMGWGCYRELVRIGRAILGDAPSVGLFGPIPTWIGACACTAAALPMLNCLQRGQVGVAKLYLLLLGFRLLVQSRTLWQTALAGLVLACPVVLKITPAVPVAIALGGQWVTAWYARTRAAWTQAGGLSLATAAGLVLGLLVLPAALIGWNANLDHLGTWWNRVALRAESTTDDDFAGDSTSVRNQSLVNATHRLGNWAHYAFFDGPLDDGPQQLRRGGPGLLMDARPVAWALLAVRGLAAGLAVAVGFRMGQAQDPVGQAAAFGMACVATLIIFPIARGHYYLLFLPAITFVCLWLVRQNRLRWAVTFAVVPCVLVIAHYVALRVVGRVGLLGLGTTVWYFAAAAAICLPPSGRGNRGETLPAETAAEWTKHSRAAA